jgi:predicted N-formylglutamate amidohydrolase
MKPEKYARKVARERMAQFDEPYHVALTQAYRKIIKRNRPPMVLSGLALIGVAWTLSLLSL